MDQIVNRTSKDAPRVEAALGIGPAPAPRRWPWVVGLLVMLLPATFFGLHYWNAAPDDRVAYTTTPVKSGDMTVETSATGTLQPLTQVDVSSELSGVVRSVRVEENQHVAKGAVLAELDTTRISAQVERAKASVEAAAAKVTDAEITLRESQQAFDRSSQLASRGMVADSSLDTAKATRDRAASALATAKANLAVADADLKLEQADLAKSTIYSPIDGIILSRDVDPGQTVASSLQAPVLFVIAEDLKRMEVVAAVDEADIGGIAKDQDASFTVDAFPGRIFEAKISDISYASTTTEGVVTYEARLAVDNADLSLRPGMTATVAIVTRHVDDALLVPNDAFRYSPPSVDEARGFSLQNIFTGRMGRRHRRRDTGSVEHGADQGLRTLYVLRDGAPSAVQVKPGATDGKTTEILSGLKAGDAVITASGSRATGGR